MRCFERYHSAAIIDVELFEVSKKVAIIGILCWPAPSHIFAIFPLGKELIANGHDVIVIGIADLAEPAKLVGLKFHCVFAEEIKTGAIKRQLRRKGSLRRITLLRMTYSDTYYADLVLRDIPSVVSELGIDLLIVDQNQWEGGSVADVCGIPFVTIATDIPQFVDDNIPPIIFGWKYRPTPFGRFRNRLGYKLFFALSKPLRKRIADFRRENHLPAHKNLDDFLSPYAVISQLPEDFDFPRRPPRQSLHYTGPFHSPESRPPASFPFERLDGKPIVYCSFGSILSQREWVFELIGKACMDLDVQLVIALGDVHSELDTGMLPKSCVVVPFAPQLEILRLASLIICHGGVNSVVEALKNGVPIIAIPMANDAYASAARVAYSNAGRRIGLTQISVGRIRREVRRILNDPRYRQNAQRLQDSIRRAGGVQRAANVIVDVLSNHSRRLE